MRLRRSSPSQRDRNNSPSDLTPSAAKLIKNMLIEDPLALIKHPIALVADQMALVADPMALVADLPLTNLDFRRLT